MCSSDTLRKILLIVAIFALPAELRAAVEVHIGADISVSGESVLLGDVATIKAARPGDIDALATLMISQFPSGQTEMQVPASYLSHRIQDALPGGTDFHLDAPDQILLRLRRTGITARELTEAIGAKARADGKIPEWVETQVELVSGLEPIKNLALAEVRVEPAGENSRWKGDITLKVLHGANVNWVHARIRWFGHVWAAVKDLSVAGAAPRAEDFEITRLELTALREEVAGATENLENLLHASHLRRGIRAHAPLVKAALEHTPDARPGQELKVVFISESGIRVQADGALLGAGSVGEEVKARLRSSHKIVVGRLVQSGLVEVNL